MLPYFERTTPSELPQGSFPIPPPNFPVLVFLQVLVLLFRIAFELLLIFLIISLSDTLCVNPNVVLIVMDYELLLL